MSTVHVAVVSTRSAAPLARATVRRALGAAPAAQVHVLDVDGTYAPTALESVLSPLDVGVRPADLHLQAMVHEPAALARALYPALVRAILAGTPSGATATVLVAQPGVLLLNPPTAVLDDAERDGLCLLARTPSPVPDDGLWPSVADVVRAGAHAPTMLALHGPQTGLLDLWERAMDQPDDTGAHWLDVVAAQVAHHTVRDAATLLSPWTLRRDHRVTDDDAGLLRLDGRPVVALDLSALDPTRPWLLDAEVSGDPRGRLSDHPVLARLVDRLAADLRADAADLAEGRPGAWDMTTTSLGTPVDAPTRGLYRTAAAAGQPAPDPFDPAAAAELRAWLTDVDPDGGPGRYLRALHRTRPDLQRAFPKVPGASTVGFLDWVRTYGHDESYPADLLDLALSQVEARSAEAPRGAERLARGRTLHGVNVVGYLRGELGIGESARLMVSALQAAGVAHSSVPIDQNLLSRQRPGPSDADAGRRRQVFDTSLICVNADLTPTVAGSVPELLSRSYRIGMWYWEVEDFGTQRVYYPGTELALGPVTPAAWAAAIQTSGPASTWGLAAGYVDMGTIGKYALAAGLLGGASFVAWALHLHTRRSLVAEPTSAIPSRGPLPALGAIAALAVFAPLPFVVTNHWSTFLLSPGRTYMHSLALLWAWAMALAVVAVKAVELRPRAVIVPALAIGLVILITLQVNVNRLVADRLKAEPTNGVDVALLLEDGGAATQQERCASLSQVATVEWVTIWLPALNEAYADRFNVTYCASLH